MPGHHYEHLSLSDLLVQINRSYSDTKPKKFFPILFMIVLDSMIEDFL